MDYLVGMLKFKPTIVLPDDEFNKIAVGTDFDPLKDVKAFDSQGQ